MTALSKVEAGLERILSLDHRYLGTQGTSHALLKQVNHASCDKEFSQPECVRRHNKMAHGSTHLIGNLLLKDGHYIQSH